LALVVEVHIADYLPPDVWEALQTIEDNTCGTLPLTESEAAAVWRGLETLPERLVLISREHNLKDPTGD
jgi:hypothetical protein